MIGKQIDDTEAIVKYKQTKVNTQNNFPCNFEKYVHFHKNIHSIIIHVNL